jgi:hypothetical protein
MKMIINRVLCVIMAASLLSACTKQDTDPLMDARPAIPVTVSNAVDYRPDPTVTTTLSGGAITIDLEIPATSGRTIKEITRVATNTSYSQIQGTTANAYVTTPIAGNGSNTIRYTTTVANYFSKNPVTSTNPAAKVNTELGLRFYFLITLDDGTKLVTVPVRVLVLQ